MNLVDGETSLRGVLYEATRGWFVLKGAEALLANGKTMAIDGDVLVDSAKVLFVQVI